ncbi:MAG TPA: NAD(P)/FAD-dependent oxidoreductase [Gemmatimonadaceae bacterium]|nr:NAD(P)/FAD-dependent oxidoreductase [Gemmatimonadaceae bacterium]
MPLEHLDVLIVGAGLSGIGAGYHIQTRCPGKSYAIFEGRSSMGGTWDLFRYPGVRSDSDMYTLGYRFQPWRNAKAIADGPSILNYIKDTAREYGIDKKIRFEHRVRRASWSTRDAQWTVDVEVGASKALTRMTCSFIYLCTGYYDYESGYTPEFRGVERFQGPVIHPQKWPENLDYAGKRVVVIGSGATAVTLVPAMAESAAHVTMLQRSPTYVVNLPSQDKIGTWLRNHLPERTAYMMTRWKNVFLQMFFYGLARGNPDYFKKMVSKGVSKSLGPEYDLRHFTPSYNPWDQRLCLVPDSDLFAAIRSGKASVVTDRIDTFTERGIKLQSGEELEADIIVTATGLNLKLMSGLQLVVDDKPVDMSKTMAYKGMMFSDIPNLASAFGYTNASWTLKCDLTSEYVCRLLNHMDRNGFAQCTPRRNDPSVVAEPVLNFSSGYVQRALSTLPSQGSRTPWRLHQNYALDLIGVRLNSVEDGVMEFRRSARLPSQRRQAAEAPR